MSETSPSPGLRPGPVEAFDWRAGRTWTAFVGLALGIGFASGSVCVAAYLLVKPHFPTEGLDMVGFVLAFAFHYPGLHLLDRLDKKSLPKDADGRPIPRWRSPDQRLWRSRELPLMLAWMVLFTAGAIAANEVGWHWWETTAPLAVVVIVIAAFACWHVLVPLMRPLVPAPA